MTQVPFHTMTMPSCGLGRKTIFQNPQVGFHGKVATLLQINIEPGPGEFFLSPMLFCRSMTFSGVLSLEGLLLSTGLPKPPSPMCALVVIAL